MSSSNSRGCNSSTSNRYIQLTVTVTTVKAVTNNTGGNSSNSISGHQLKNNGVNVTEKVLLMFCYLNIDQERT